MAAWRNQRYYANNAEEGAGITGLRTAYGHVIDEIDRILGGNVATET